MSGSLKIFVLKIVIFRGGVGQYRGELGHRPGRTGTDYINTYTSTHDCPRVNIITHIYKVHK